MAETKIKLKQNGLKSFFDKNPGFDILTFDFHNKKALEQLKGIDKDRFKKLDTLKTYQRLLRVGLHGKGTDHKSTSMTVTETALNIAECLKTGGFESAHQIAAIPEHKFVRDYSHLFDGDKTKARSVHRAATDIKAKARHLFANIHATVGSHHYKATLAANTDPELEDYFTSIPSYQDLFGGLNYLSTQHCSSIFGPAAYFLDMMRITDQYITDPNTHKENADENIPTGYRLEERRPDLFDLKLDCENTNRPVPFLDIVNRVLERRVGNELKITSGTAQGGTKDSITLASNASDKDGAYNNMWVTITAGKGVGQARTVSSYTGASRTASVNSTWDENPDKTSVYNISKNTFQELAAAPYPFNLPFNLPLTQIRRYLENMKSTLAEIFTRFGGPVTGGTAQAGTSTSITLASSASPDTGAYASMQVTIINGTGAGQLRKIASYNGGTKQADVDVPWETAPDNTSQYHIFDLLGTAREIIGISVEQYEDLITVNDTDAGVAPLYGYTTIDMNKIARVQVFLKRTGLDWDRLERLLTQGLSTTELPVLAPDLYINDTGESLPYMQIVTDTTDPDNPFYKIANLSLKRLDRLSRFIRLTGFLDWSFAHLNWALVSLRTHTGAADQYKTAEIDRQTIISLAGIKRLKNTTGLEVDVLCAFWYDIKNIGKGDNPTPDDLFDRVFNNPAQLQGLDPYTSIQPIPFDPARPMNWTVENTTGDNRIIRSRLTAALQVNDNDLTLLGKYLQALLDLKEKPITLNLVNLTWLYRLSKGPAAFNLSVDEYLVLMRLMYYPHAEYMSPPPNGIHVTVEGILVQKEKVDWFNRTPLTVYEALYILEGVSSPFFDAPYNPGDIAPFIENLSTISESSRVSGDSFIFGDIDAQHSLSIFKELQADNFLTGIGLVLNQKSSYQEAANQFPLNENSFKTVEITADESKRVYKDLQTSHPPILIPVGTGNTATLSPWLNKQTDLDFLFAGDRDAANKRNQVRNILLEARGKIDITEFAFLFMLKTTSFITEQISPAQSAEAFAQLEQNYPKGSPRHILIAHGDDTALLNADFNETTPLDFLFKSTGAGQSKTITAYTGATRTATVDTAWKTVPNETSIYAILKTTNSGTAQGGTKSTIILAADASSTEDEYDGDSVTITGGTGKDQVRQIIGYDGTSKTAAVDPDWDIAPDNTSVYIVTEVQDQGTAQSGAASTIQLSESASSEDGAYTGMTVSIIPDPDAGLKRGQVKQVLLAARNNTAHTAGVIDGAQLLQVSNVMQGLAEFLGTTTGMLDAALPFAGEETGMADFISVFLTPIPGGQVPPEIPPFIAILARSLVLFQRLVYTIPQVQAVVDIPGAFNIENTGDITFDNIQSLSLFKTLEKELNDSDGSLIAYFNLPQDDTCPGPKIGALSALTLWPPAQVCTLNDVFWPKDKGVSLFDYTTVNGVGRLKGAFDVAAQTGMNINNLLQLETLSTLPVIDGNGTIIQANWNIYTALAAAVLGAVNARLGDKEFEAVNGENTGYLDMQKRDALVGYTIWVLNNASFKKYSPLDTPSALYQYLLIDVEMSGCDITSMIAQGIASIQLYMQRCRMKIEPGVTDVKIPEVWWDWMSNYRVWEANRKIFLYPENYIEPGLRKHATPLFRNLQENLLQTDVGEESVENAFVTYFDGFDAAANLVYCDSYYCPVKNPDTGEAVQTLFLFGRSNTDPYTYYYRTYVDQLKLWTPWEKIDLTINSFYITPVYAFDRLFIFWVEVEPESITPIDGGSQKPTQTSYRAAVKYSFFNAHKNWVQPQNLNNYIVFDYTPDTYTQPGDYIVPSYINPETLFNKKLYALTVPAKVIKGTATTAEQLFPERIVLMFGNIYVLPQDNVDVPARPDKSKYTDMDKYNFDMSIYQVTYRANATVNKAFLPGYIFLNTLHVLTPNLVEETPRGIILDYNDTIDDPQPYRSSINLDNLTLNVIPGNNIIYDNYYGDYTSRPESGDELSEKAVGGDGTGGIGGSEAAQSLTLLYNISELNANIMNVKNQPGWFIFDNGNEEFLLTADDPNLKTITGVLIELDKPVSGLPGELDFMSGAYTSSKIDFNNLKFVVTRLTTNTIQPLSRRLFSGGIDSLISLTSQEEPELPFSRFYQAGQSQPPATIIIPDPEQFKKLDFNGSYGPYFWEVFFHNPFLVAEQLRLNRKYPDSMQWYQYIFNPTQDLEEDGSDPEKRFWRFLPFRSMDLPTLTEILRNQAQIAVYNNDPFDPHAIARLRISAYAKSIVLKYIDNLLDWADQLFAQDTRESITQAVNLYVMAADLLGQRPQAVGEFPVPDPASYNQIRQHYEVVTTGTARGGTLSTIQLAADASSENGVYNGLTVKITAGKGQGQSGKIMSYNGSDKIASVFPQWPQAPDTTSGYSIGGIPEFLIQLENTPMVYMETNSAQSLQSSDLPFNDINSYFSVPENSELILYWDKVADRLFKIRHCLNIQGVERQLALFSPPINPRALVAAAASGTGGLSTANTLEPQVPYFRFDIMLEKARSLTSTLSQLGSSLLAALEKKDAEALALLRNAQEKTILNLTTMIKEKQIEEVEETGVSLGESLNSAKERYNYYNGLYNRGLSAGEIANIVAMTTATVFNVLAGVLRTASAIGYAVPNVGSPFAMTYGGKQIGAALQGASGAMEILATLSNFAAQLSITVAGYERRAEEWKFQATLAEFDQKQIQAQIAANKLRKQITEQELVIHNETIKQNKEMELFMENKFTNEQLYQWMVSRLSTLYFQTYSLALDLARSAQRAYQYEFNTAQTFVNFGYWDSLHKGLLSGEGLMLALNQMEKAALDNSSRSLEITKTISLVQLNPKALLDLKETGECLFELSEKLYDYDFPGHYARKIKTLSISIPAIVGPYRNIKATLTQLSNQTVIKAGTEGVGAVNFLLGGDRAENPPADVLRSNWWVNQQIALSNGVNDSGMFELNFNDAQYLPFEGTGAVSTWRLSMPIATNNIDFSTISDVVINLKYTASNGGAKFRQDILSLPAMQPYYGAGFLSLAQQYSQQWYGFLHDLPAGSTQTMTFAVPANILPLHLKPGTGRLDGFYFTMEVAEGIGTSSPKSFISVNIPGEAAIPVTLSENNTFTYEFSRNREPKLENIAGIWSVPFDLDNAPADMVETVTIDDKQIKRLKPDVIKNIQLILYYKGKINWK